MKKNKTKAIMKGVGIGMMVTGGAAILGSMMKTKKNSPMTYLESMISSMGSMLK